jgi:hypothetical protein
VKASRTAVGLAQVMFWTSACTALWLLPAALLTEVKIVPQTLEGWLAVGGLALISQIIGQGMISWALGLLPAAFSAVSLLVNPVASGIFAWIILGEALTAAQIGGGLAVLAGIFVARPKPQSPATTQPEDAAPPQTCRSFDLTRPARPIECRAKGGAVTDDRDILQRLFAAAIGAVDPLKILAPHLPSPPRAARSCSAPARPPRHGQGGGGQLARPALPASSSRATATAAVPADRGGRSLAPGPDAAGQQAARRILPLTKASPRTISCFAWCPAALPRCLRCRAKG